ncbi:MAG: response regulator transcription factor [Deltaproteobacteria bacterium]|nr:response regulator transcription factor [Deltaproteobacteria bacterium]MDQ3298361.1 response regulator transcription factor [Myxococcota bacterium]
MIRVQVIDDMPLLRIGVATVIEHTPTMRLIRASTSAELDAHRGEEVDVVVVGVCAAPLGTLGVVRLVRGELRPPALLALCVQPDAICASVYLRAGATGCGLVSQSEAELVESITRVAQGVRCLPAGVDLDDVEELLRTTSRWGLDQLTARECEIFGLLIRGVTNEDAAAQLGISCRTVETHRRSIMHKLAARSIVDILHAAARYGILVSPPRTLPTRGPR